MLTGLGTSWNRYAIRRRSRFEEPDELTMVGTETFAGLRSSAMSTVPEVHRCRSLPPRIGLVPLNQAGGSPARSAVELLESGR